MHVRKLLARRCVRWARGCTRRLRGRPELLQRPQTPVAATFVGAEATVPTPPTTAPAQFWTQFDDDTLDRLVDEALAANHDLRIALGHLAEARALRRQAQFDLAPTVTASGGYTNTAAFRRLRVWSVRRMNARYYDAGFDAFWELDLFGRMRRNVEAQTRGGCRAPRRACAMRRCQSPLRSRGPTSSCAASRRSSRSRSATSTTSSETLQFTQAQLDAGRGTELDTSRAQCAADHDARHHRAARGRGGALHPPPQRAHWARAQCAAGTAGAAARPAGAATDHRRSAIRRDCCAVGPIFASPSGSWPPPPRGSA